MKILKESAQVNTAAEKDYLDGIQQGYIDIDAFHLAYDDIIKEVGARLEDLFYKRGDKVLKSKGSYSDIKLMKGFNNPVYDAMISLWLAQFKNNLPLKKVAVANQVAASTKGQATANNSTVRIDLVKQAVETLNKAKGVNFKLADLQERPNGDVMFTMTYPNGTKNYWGFPDSWFNPEHEHSDAVMKILKQIPKNFTADQKVIAKMIAYIWSVRDFRG